MVTKPKKKWMNDSLNNQHIRKLYHVPPKLRRHSPANDHSKGVCPVLVICRGVPASLQCINIKMSPIYIDGAHLYEADLDFYQRMPKSDRKALSTLAVNFSWVGCCAKVQ